VPSECNIPFVSQFFEIDLPEVLRYKNEILGSFEATPVCERVCVEAYLAGETWMEQLVANGFEKSKPSAWVLEGLLMYLSESEVESLLAKISNLTVRGSKAIFHFFPGDFQHIVGNFKGPISKHNIQVKFGTNEPFVLLERFSFSDFKLLNFDTDCIEIARNNKRIEDLNLTNKPGGVFSFFVLATKS